MTKYIKPPRSEDCEWRSGPPPEIGWWPADGTVAGGPYPQILRYWNGHYFSDAVHHTDDARTAGQFGRIKHPCAYEILWTDRWWEK
jgi:hypothetical protein